MELAHTSVQVPSLGYTITGGVFKTVLLYSNAMYVGNITELTIAYDTQRQKYDFSPFKLL